MSEIEIIGTLPDGKPIRGYEVDYETDKEPWSEYHLSDGTRVRVKNAVVKMHVVVGDDGQPLTDQAGNLQMFVTGNVLISTTTPKKKGD